MMKKVLLVSGLMMALGGFLGLPSAQAVSIGFVPSSQNVNVGDMLTMDIVVSGLEAGGLDEIVSAFDLDVTYNSSILSAKPVAFGTELGFSLQSSDISVAGTVDLAEVSIETDATLQGNQGDSVTLATLGFTAIGSGSTSLDFVFNAFNDVKGLNNTPLVFNPINSGNVTVSGTAPIPEPSTLILFGTGMLGLLAAQAQRRKRKTANDN